MNKEEEIIKGCKNFNAHYQKVLYDRYASLMMSVCLRYAKDREEAKDILQEGFIKIFNKISDYRNEGSFEGWLKRIMVNNAIDYIRKNRKVNFVDVESEAESLEDTYHSELSEEEPHYTHEELLKAIDSLSDEFKIVFNLSCVENYSHKEIARILLIKEETSRTRLARARKQIISYLIKIKPNTKYQYR